MLYDDKYSSFSYVCKPLVIMLTEINTETKYYRLLLLRPPAGATRSVPDNIVL
jgi:hypothetical protein